MACTVKALSLSSAQAIPNTACDSTSCVYWRIPVICALVRMCVAGFDRAPEQRTAVRAVNPTIKLQSAVVVARDADVTVCVRSSGVEGDDGCCVYVCGCVLRREQAGGIVPPACLPAFLPACLLVHLFVCLLRMGTERRLHKNTSLLGHDKEMTQYVVTRADHGQRT